MSTHAAFDVYHLCVRVCVYVRACVHRCQHMLVYVYRVPMCSSSVGPRVRVVRVLSSALRFALDRNTITPPQTSDSSDLGNVINERKKPEVYDLRVYS